MFCSRPTGKGTYLPVSYLGIMIIVPSYLALPVNSGGYVRIG